MGNRIPKLPKAREVYERNRQVPLRVKNAKPFQYGYPTATSIPGNKNGIVVPCAPFDDFDGDRRWCICESKEQAIRLLDLYIREWQKQGKESRCVYYKTKADGTVIGVRCRANCLHCPKLIESEDPDAPTWLYERTGKTISLDFKYDEDDPEESEHDVPDTTSENPEEYCERLDEERILEELISERDELDRKILRLLLEDNSLSERDIQKVIHVSNSTIHKRLTRLRAWAKNGFQKK